MTARAISSIKYVLPSDNKCWKFCIPTTLTKITGIILTREVQKVSKRFPKGGKREPACVLRAACRASIELPLTLATPGSDTFI